MKSFLTPPQEHVLALISAGSSITAAAQAADIHRNTVHNWVTTSSDFRIGLLRAREAKAFYWREQAEELASTAIQTIRAILTDSTQPAAVRLKAAQSILALATTPVLSSATSVVSCVPANLEPVHNSAQMPTQPQPPPEPPAPCPPTPRPEPTPPPNQLHNSAPQQSPEPPAPSAQDAGRPRNRPGRTAGLATGTSAFDRVRRPILSWLTRMFCDLCTPPIHAEKAHSS